MCVLLNRRQCPLERPLPLCLGCPWPRCPHSCPPHVLHVRPWCPRPPHSGTCRRTPRGAASTPGCCGWQLTWSLSPPPRSSRAATSSSAPVTPLLVSDPARPRSDPRPAFACARSCQLSDCKTERIQTRTVSNSGPTAWQLLWLDN